MLFLRERRRSVNSAGGHPLKVNMLSLHGLQQRLLAFEGMSSATQHSDGIKNRAAIVPDMYQVSSKENTFCKTRGRSITQLAKIEHRPLYNWSNSQRALICMSLHATDCHVLCVCVWLGSKHNQLYRLLLCAELLCVAFAFGCQVQCGYSYFLLDQL